MRAVAFRSERGFTMIELLGVLLMMSAAAVFAGSYLQDRSSRIDKEASEVAGALRLARAKAVFRSGYAGVKFDVANGTFRVFEDVGVDGLGPADSAYPGKDTGEDNGDYDEGERSVARLSLEALRYGFATDDANTLSPEGRGTSIGSGDELDPVPATNDALVFGPRGKLTTPTDGNPPPYFVYLVDALRTEIRAIRVDPWTGSVQIYRWTWSSTRWSVQS